MTAAGAIKRGRELKGTMDSQERKAEGKALALRLERDGTEGSKALAEKLRADLKIPSAYDLEGGKNIDKLNK